MKLHIEEYWGEMLLLIGTYKGWMLFLLFLTEFDLWGYYVSEVGFVMGLPGFFIIMEFLTHGN